MKGFIIEKDVYIHESGWILNFRVLREIAEANKECHELAMKVMDENVREIERKKSLRTSHKEQKIDEQRPERKVRRKKSSKKYRDKERPLYDQG